MTEILFYHLEQSPLEKVLPMLLQKSLERGWKCVVQIGEESQIAKLDKALWTFQAQSFLPHGIYVEYGENAHPILLCAGTENPNAAEARFFVAGAIPDENFQKLAPYERLIFMFDGHNPDAVTNARTAWKNLSENHQTTYWQQEASGRWTKKG